MPVAAETLGPPAFRRCEALDLLLGLEEGAPFRCWQVILIGATNRIDSLDAALRRQGALLTGRNPAAPTR